MCSGADTPIDEKQDNIEANMVHVYKELIAPLIAIKTPKIRTSSRILAYFMVQRADHLLKTKNRITYLANMVSCFSYLGAIAP